MRAANLDKNPALNTAQIPAPPASKFEFGGEAGENRAINLGEKWREIWAKNGAKMARNFIENAAQIPAQNPVQNPPNSNLGKNPALNTAQIPAPPASKFEFGRVCAALAAPAAFAVVFALGAFVLAAPAAAAPIGSLIPAAQTKNQTPTAKNQTAKTKTPPQKFELFTDGVVVQTTPNAAAQNATKTPAIVTLGSKNLIFSQDYLLSAKSATLDTARDHLTLAGNVTLLQGAQSLFAAAANVSTATGQVNASGVFAYDSDSGVWLEAASVCAAQNITLTTRALLSSCEPAAPAWSVGFSSSRHDKSREFLHLYNAVFYAGRLPIFYLPYFGFPTAQQRTSGFLYPDASFKRKEGLRLLVPFYLAPQDWWDLQIDPQVRNRRGYGVGAAFRWADSPTGTGEVRYGVFREKWHYVASENLLNRDHHGVEFRYRRDELLAPYLRAAQEGLWIDATWLNDLEYLNTKAKKDDYDALVTSRLNYFLGWERDYAGVYARYYIDTARLGTANENRATLQELPTLHYHRAVTPFAYARSSDAWWQRALGAFNYALDVKAHNYARELGVTARHYELDLPLSLSVPLGEWVNLGITERLYGAHIDYNRHFDVGCEAANRCTTLTPNPREDYLRTYTQITLNSNLAKNYGAVFHTLDASLSFVEPGIQRGQIAPKLLKNYALRGRNYTAAGFWEDNFIQGLESRYTTQNAILSATNQLYWRDGTRFLRHYFEQGFDFESNEFGNLRSKTEIFIGGVTLKNALEYSRTHKALTAYQNSLALNSRYVRFSATQTFERRENRTPDNENYLTSNLALKLSKRFELTGGWDYDITRSYKKSWRAGVLARFGCWHVGFSYTEDTKPRNTKTGVRPNREEEFYLYFRFYPVGQVGYSYGIDHEY